VRGWIVRIAIIAAIAIGAFVFRDRLSSGAGDLKVGDCFDEPKAAETIEEVQHQPCTETHDNEVMVVVDHPAAKDEAYPSDAEFEAFIDERCTSSVYQAYSGRDPATEEEIGLAWYVPTAEGWADGTRTVICYLFRNDATKMTAPLRVSS
jgi:hypothetical protein